MAVIAPFDPPRKLAAGDSVEGFCCGAAPIDDWVSNRALDAEKRGTAVVYGVYSGSDLAGFYSLSSHSIAREDATGWLRRNSTSQIPAILLGMLGVDERFKGQGLGASLLRDAIVRSLAVSEQIGAKALLVDPIDERAKAFYVRYGFKELQGTERMFLPLRHA